MAVRPIWMLYQNYKEYIILDMDSEAVKSLHDGGSFKFAQIPFTASSVTANNCNVWLQRWSA